MFTFRASTEHGTDHRDGCVYVALEEQGRYFIWVVERDGTTQAVMSNFDPAAVGSSQLAHLQGLSLEETCAQYGSWHDEPLTVSELQSVDSLPPIGVIHPRVWRPTKTLLGPSVSDLLVTDAQPVLQQSIVSIRSLINRLLSAFEVVEPHPHHLDAYGHEFRSILILAATEVEAMCAGILRANGYSKKGNGDWGTNDYVKLAEPLFLNRYHLQLALYPQLGTYSPFSGWPSTSPTQALPWYAAYNKTKHDRETDFEKASMRNAVEAVLATVTMLVAQFGPVPELNAPPLSEIRIARLAEHEFPNVYFKMKSLGWTLAPRSF